MTSTAFVGLTHLLWDYLNIVDLLAVISMLAYTISEDSPKLMHWPNDH